MNETTPNVDRTYEICRPPTIEKRTNEVGATTYRVRWGGPVGSYRNKITAQIVRKALEHLHTCNIRPIYLSEVQNLMHVAGVERHSPINPLRQYEEVRR